MMILIIKNISNKKNVNNNVDLEIQYFNKINILKESKDNKNTLKIKYLIITRIIIFLN